MGFGQVNAAYILNAALGFSRANGSTGRVYVFRPLLSAAKRKLSPEGTSKPSTPSLTSSSNSNAVIGAAVGGAVGGLILIGVVTTIVFLRRRHAGHLQEQIHTPFPLEMYKSTDPPGASGTESMAAATQLQPPSLVYVSDTNAPPYTRTADHGSVNDVSSIHTLLSTLATTLQGMMSPPRYDGRLAP